MVSHAAICPPTVRGCGGEPRSDSVRRWRPWEEWLFWDALTDRRAIQNDKRGAYNQFSLCSIFRNSSGLLLVK